jgi:transcriptional regulator with XRE-family HTH domain
MIEPLPMSAEELRRIMTELRLTTHDDLASRIGVSRSAVSLWKSGRVAVPNPIAMLLRLMVMEHA